MKLIITSGTLVLVLAILLNQVFGSVEPVRSREPLGASASAVHHDIYDPERRDASNVIMSDERTSDNIKRSACKETGFTEISFISYNDIKFAEMIQKYNLLSVLGHDVKIFFLENYDADDFFSRLRDKDFAPINLIVSCFGNLHLKPVLLSERISAHKKFIVFHHFIHPTVVAESGGRAVLVNCINRSLATLTPCPPGDRALCCASQPIEQLHKFFTEDRKCTDFSVESLTGIIAKVRENSSRWHVVARREGHARIDSGESHFLQF